MKLKDIMTTRIATVEMDDSLKLAKEIFENTKFHHLPVREGKKLMGIISDRDLVKNLSPFISTPSERIQDLNTLKKKVHQIMSRDLVTASADTTVKDAVALILNENISCLPVVSSDGELEGLVTTTDLMQALISAPFVQEPSESADS